MGFDGFVVTDWNGIGEVPGCTNDSCAAGDQRRRRHGDGAGRLEDLHQNTIAEVEKPAAFRCRASTTP
jgi:hypothetical protein